MMDLGIWVEYEGGIVNEIKRRIGKVTSAFNKLKPLKDIAAQKNTVNV